MIPSISDIKFNPESRVITNVIMYMKSVSVFIKLLFVCTQVLKGKKLVIISNHYGLIVEYIIWRTSYTLNIPKLKEYCGSHLQINYHTATD